MILPFLQALDGKMRQLRAAKSTTQADREDSSAAFPPDLPNVCGVQQCFSLFGAEPIAKSHSEFLCALDAADASRQLGAQQSRIGGFVCQSSNSGQSQVDRGRGQVTGFQLQPVPQDDGLVKDQPRLRTVPRNKIVDGKPV